MLTIEQNKKEEAHMGHKKASCRWLRTTYREKISAISEPMDRPEKKRTLLLSNFTILFSKLNK